MKTTPVRNPISSKWYYIIKYIAIIFMVIDYIPKTLDIPFDSVTVVSMFILGRIAFPLFAWELVGCFHFTKNPKKHLLGLGILAVISEVPYDKALTLKWIDWEGQNVCFTFFISWLMLMAMNADWEKIFNGFGIKRTGFRKLSEKTAGLCCAGTLMFLATKFKVDYEFGGVCLVFLFELSRNRKWRPFWEFISLSFFIGYVGTHSIEGMNIVHLYYICFVCLIFMWIAEYNANKHPNKKFPEKSLLLSRTSKRICRFFYPAHLIILVIANMIINGVIMK